MPSPLLKKLSELNIQVFLETYNITNDQGEILDFKDHPYLWDIFNDLTPRQAYLKAAQIGMSTTINIKALWVAKNKKMDIIYSLPSAADIKEFVSGKTNRLIANNPILGEWTKDKDSIEQKRVGENVIYFRGTWTERAAISIPADLYISDETDRSKQEIVTQYKTRLQHSKHGWEWYFSNPSAPGVGVDKHWEESDQKHWFIMCECGHEWFIGMENIMYDNEGKPYFGCLKCKKELDRRNGRWIRKYNDRTISGYWIPLLIVPRISAQYILDKQKELSEDQFANFVLGKPFIGKGNKLTRQMFFQNLTDVVNPQDSRLIIGVDTGKGINLIAGNKHGLFFFDKRDNYDMVERLLQRYPSSIAVIDQGGDIIGPRKLREKYPNRVFLCFFRADQKNDKFVTWKDEDGTVVADRNKCIQTVVDEISEKRIPMSGTESEWWDVWTEWDGMYRTQEDNAMGVPVFKWNKPATGRCDYPFAMVYWRVGIDRFSENISTFHDPNGDSFASQGYEPNPDGTMFLPRKKLS